MVNAVNVDLVSVEAGTAVTIYRLVVRAADGQYDHVGVAQAEADGVCAESQATVGKVFPMAALKAGSIVKVEAGASVSALDVVASDNVGRAITAVSGVGNWRLGKALDAGDAGDIIRVQVLKDLDQVA